MSAMIREKVSEPKKPFWKTMLSIFTVVITINMLVELTNYLPPKYSGAASIFILILSALFCSYIINRKLAKYIYILIDNELTFYKEIGKREKKILDIQVENIEWIKPAAEVSGREKYKKTYGLSCRLRGEGIYTGQFQQNDKTYRFIFQPSENLYKQLMKRIGKRSE